MTRIERQLSSNFESCRKTNFFYASNAFYTNFFFREKEKEAFENVHESAPPLMRSGWHTSFSISHEYGNFFSLIRQRCWPWRHMSRSVKLVKHTFHWSSKKRPPEVNVVRWVRIHLTVERRRFLLGNARNGPGRWNAPTSRRVCWIKTKKKGRKKESYRHCLINEDIRGSIYGLNNETAATFPSHRSSLTSWSDRLRCVSQLFHPQRHSTNSTGR